MSSKHLLCLACGIESVVEANSDKGIYTVDHEHGHGCPACGDTGVPADLADAVDVHITKHELRILTIWATNYARAQPELTAPYRSKTTNMSRVMQTIVDRLGVQTDVALTLSQEVADVRAAYPGISVVDADGKELDL
jgi:hypothetical protein